MTNQETDINFHYIKSVNVSDSVLCQLVPEHGESSQICIQLFRKIGHSIITVLHKIRYQLRIFSVILKLAVIFNLFALVLPQVYVRPTLTVAEFFRKKGESTK